MYALINKNVQRIFMKQHEPDHILKAYITNCHCFLCSHTVVFVHMFHEIDITITEIKWYTILSIFIVYSLANTELALAQRKRDQYHVTSVEQPLVSLCYLALSFVTAACLPA